MTSGRPHHCCTSQHSAGLHCSLTLPQEALSGSFLVQRPSQEEKDTDSNLIMSTVNPPQSGGCQLSQLEVWKCRQESHRDNCNYASWLASYQRGQLYTYLGVYHCSKLQNTSQKVRPATQAFFELLQIASTCGRGSFGQTNLTALLSSFLLCPTYRSGTDMNPAKVKYYQLQHTNKVQKCSY